MTNFSLKFGINFVIDALMLALLYYIITFTIGPVDLNALVLGCTMCVGMYAMKWITARKCNNGEIANDAVAQMTSMSILALLVSFMV